MTMVRSSAVRRSVSLTDDQVAVLRLVRQEGTPERQALERATGPLPDDSSDARTLSRLIDLATRMLADVRLDVGYAALAEATDGDDAAHSQAVRSRRR